MHRAVLARRHHCTERALSDMLEALEAAVALSSAGERAVGLRVCLVAGEAARVGLGEVRGGGGGGLVGDVEWVGRVGGGAKDPRVRHVESMKPRGGR
mmetsp:Transcript_18070/g.32999  ORF Transcript_18070/g.32999 Transcript_18070/m.32999 type:complete len:97 (-) Transcript_18070:1124-1414(-)